MNNELAVEQKRTVAKYRKEFVTKLTHLAKVAESVMFKRFFRGLKPEIKFELRVLGPTMLEQDMSWAEKIDQKLRAQTWLGRRIGQAKIYSPKNPNHSNYQTTLQPSNYHVNQK